MKQTILIIFLVFNFIGINAQVQTRTIINEIDIENINVIHLKAGMEIEKLNITTWNNPKIRVVASLEFDPGENEKYEELISEFKYKISSNIFNNVELDLNQLLVFGHFGVLTSRDHKSYALKDENKGIRTTGLFGPKFVFHELKLLKINIELYIPESNILDIDANFTDIKLDYCNKTNLVLKNSSFKSRSMNKVKIESTFSKIYIDKIKEAHFDLANSELHSKSIDKAILDAKFSNINIDKISDLKTEVSNTSLTSKSINFLEINESNFSNISCEKNNETKIRNSNNNSLTIENLNTFLSFDTNFNTYKIGELNKSGKIKSSRQDKVEFNKLSKSFTTLEVMSKLGELRINYSNLDELILEISKQQYQTVNANNLTVLNNTKENYKAYRKNQNSSKKIFIHSSQTNLILN